MYHVAPELDGDAPRGLSADGDVEPARPCLKFNRALFYHTILSANREVEPARPEPLFGATQDDRLRVGWINGWEECRETQKMLKGHLPSVIYHQVY